MANLLNHLFGLLMPNAASKRDAPAPAAPTPPAQIPYAHTAPELCMLPRDLILTDVGTDLSPGPHVVQCKADGIRALYIDGRIVSREGAPLDCALHCQPGLARLEEAAGLGPLVFDGEYVAEDGFEATLAEHKKGVGSGVFWIFDVMPLVEWQSGKCHLAVQDRLRLLRKLVLEHCDSLFVGMLDFWLLDRQGAIAKAREIWAAGGEGIVIKRINSGYERCRSDAWLRIKQTHTIDAMIVDLMERPDGTLKRLIVRHDEEQFVIGTGWTKDEGKRLVRDFKSGVLGSSANSWVEISFQRTTGAKRSVRGARFIRRRAAKGAQA